jgi:hypothetical protein
MSSHIDPKHKLPAEPVAVQFDQDSKGEIELQEDINREKVLFDAAEENANSPEAILQRYPLLREMDQTQLDKLNRRVRRRM